MLIKKEKGYWFYLSVKLLKLMSQKYRDTGQIGFRHLQKFTHF